MQKSPIIPAAGPTTRTDIASLGAANPTALSLHGNGLTSQLSSAPAAAPGALGPTLPAPALGPSIMPPIADAAWNEDARGPAAVLILPDSVEASAETVFFDHDGIRVSQTEFRIGEDSIPISEIRKFESHPASPNRIGPVSILFIGGVLVFAGKSSFVVAGVILLIVSVVWLLSQSGKYRFVMKTESADKEVTIECLPERASNIVKAVENAMKR